MLQCRTRSAVVSSASSSRSTRLTSTVYRPARPSCHLQYCKKAGPTSTSAGLTNRGNAAVVPRASAGSTGNGSTGNGDSSSKSSTNGSNPEASPPNPPDNGGNGGNGSSGGGSAGNGSPGRPSGGDSNHNRQPAGFRLPLSSEQLSYAVLGLTALSALLLFAALRHSVLVRTLEASMQTVFASLSGMADGESTRESVAALKRLLREVFAEQLSIKQRLSDAEAAAKGAAQLEAADDYQLRLALGGSSSWTRAPVRMSGHVVAAGVLPWSQEGNTSETLSMLSGLGVYGAADARLQLHSVLAGGRRRVTAEFSQAAQDGAAAALKLHSLLFRVQVKEWLKLMIAPMGGGLEALGRSITPVRGDFGCTQALRHGHGLTVLQQLGGGKAISLSSRRLSATAGLFVGGDCKTGIARLQARTLDGHSVSLVAANSTVQPETADVPSSTIEQPSSACKGGLRFLGVQSPHRLSTRPSKQLLSGQVLGAAGVVPLTDSCTATAWTEKPLSGTAGWGLGLYCQPDDDGLELGLAVGKPAAANQQASQ